MAKFIGFSFHFGPLVNCRFSQLPAESRVFFPDIPVPREYCLKKDWNAWELDQRYFPAVKTTFWGRLFEGRLAYTVDKSNLNHTPIYLVND